MFSLDNCDHHEDLLPCRDLDQLAPAGLADIGCLGVQHVGQRGAPLDRDGHTLGEPGDQWQAARASQAVEGLSDRFTRAHSGQHHAEVARELAATSTYDAVERRDRALPGGDGERQELGDHRELRHHLPLTGRDLGGEIGVARQHTGGEADRAQEQRRDRAAATAERVEQAVRRDEGEAGQPPEHLLDPEVVDRLVEGGAFEPATDGAGSAEHPLDGNRRGPQHRPEDPGRRGDR
jgi:hypothetical protein